MMEGELELWYGKPASSWEEALPIGNGRMGAMISGGIDRELVYLNEDSIWSKGPESRINKDAKKYLPEIRQLLRAGKIGEAERLTMMALAGTPNSESSYEPAGTLDLIYEDHPSCEDYRRSLDMETGCVQVSYRVGEAAYTEEWYASEPDQAIVCHLKAEGGTLNLVCHLDRCHNRVNRVWGEQDEVGFEVSEGVIAPFAVRLKGKTLGGSICTIGEHLVIRGATEVTLLLDIRTRFYEEDYLKAGAAHLQQLIQKSASVLRDNHLREYQSGFGKCTLRLDGHREVPEGLPTDVRLQAVSEGKADPGMYALYFQYGRYLLFSSSRGNCQPANLQGIWNKELQAPWDSKYTININAEMNYWIAESGNLSACHLPFFTLLKRLCENGKQTAEQMYGCKGSVAHHNTDLKGDTAPQDLCITATFWPMGEAWMSTHIMQHYRYSGDTEFLREHFEILEENLAFFEDFLIENASGELVTSPSISPENTYILPDGTKGSVCEGPTMDIEILTELLQDYVTASGELEKAYGKPFGDPERATRILNRLPKIRIGKYGQIMEWVEDYDEFEPGHRHISHLYGVYPGTTISYEKTPELMDAAKATLERRLSYGGGHTGWSRAWIIGLWAKFRDGEKVYENLQALLRQSTFPNLMDSHPYYIPSAIFQIDGNLGAAAAMIEMLVQYNDGEVRLLPALPEEFSEGSVHGVKLPGGLTLDMTWKDGKVTNWDISGTMTEKDIMVYVNGTEHHLQQEEI